MEAIQSASAKEVISTAIPTVAIEIVGYHILASEAAVLESANIFLRLLSLRPQWPGNDQVSLR